MKIFSQKKNVEINLFECEHSFQLPITVKMKEIFDFLITNTTITKKHKTKYRINKFSPIKQNRLLFGGYMKYGKFDKLNGIKILQKINHFNLYEINRFVS